MTKVLRKHRVLKKRVDNDKNDPGGAEELERVFSKLSESAFDEWNSQESERAFRNL